MKPTSICAGALVVFVIHGSIVLPIFGELATPKAAAASHIVHRSCRAYAFAARQIDGHTPGRTGKADGQPHTLRTRTSVLSIDNHPPCARSSITFVSDFSRIAWVVHKPIMPHKNEARLHKHPPQNESLLILSPA